MEASKLFILKEKLKKDFDNYLLSIDALINLGTDVSLIILDSLKNLKKGYEPLSGFIPFKEKLERNIEMIDKIKNHPILREKYDVIYGQALVLLVSAFESLMTNLFTSLINEFPEKINWPEKKTIGVDLNLLRYYSNIGDLVLKSLKGQPNFQDWQSTLNFLKENLNINIGKDISREEQETIIFYQATRHIIIHNSAKIDPDFIKQIRNTKFFPEYENRNDAKIEIKEKNYKEAKALFEKVVKVIIDKLK